MATVEEVLAKADAWEKAGNSENAAKLRAYAETLQPAAPKYDRTAVEAKAAEWEKAGQTDKAAKLREFATTLPSAEAAKPEGWDSPDAPPPQGFPGTPESDARAVAEFEKFNPELKGRYKTFAELPKVGTSAGISGGTSRSGGIPLIVREWQGVGAKQGTFGDTAAAMVAGPMEGARAFGAGIMDSSVSPSRDFLANDPLTKNLPSWMLTGMGKVADVGGAGLSIVGAGLAGATGLGAELVPGQNAADERKLAEETLAMSMFAVPELAGASSVPARMASVAPKAAAVAEAAPKVVGDVAKAAVKSPEEIGSLARKAASGGMGSVKAQEALAAEAKINLEAKAAADRLGIDLPADVFSDNETVKATVGLTRSEVGKEPEALWRRAVKGARDKADEIIAAMDGSPDIASVSETVKGALQATQANLKNTAKLLYEAVDFSVPKGTKADVSNVVRALNGVIEDIGGVKGMTGQEKALYDLVTDPNQVVTYGRLLREKNLIGKAIARGDSPYSSMDSATLNRLYSAISEDQLATVASIGDDALRAKLREANQLTAKQKALEKRIVTAFGSDLDGSIGAKLKSAVTTAAKGDIAGLQRILKVIPEELRQSATASAIAAATRSARATEPGFGLSEFSKVFGGIMTNKPVYNLISKTLGGDAIAMLKDLHTVAQRIASADGNVLRTGKANQALAGALTADGIVSKVLNSTAGQRVTQAAAIGAGTMTGGPMMGMVAGPIASALTKGSPDMLARAGKLFASEPFQRLMVEAATASPKAETIATLNRFKPFMDWAKSVGIKNVEELLKDTAAPLSQGVAQSANTDLPPARALP